MKQKKKQIEVSPHNQRTMLVKVETYSTEVLMPPRKGEQYGEWVVNPKHPDSKRCVSLTAEYKDGRGNPGFPTTFTPKDARAIAEAMIKMADALEQEAS